MTTPTSCPPHCQQLQYFGTCQSSPTWCQHGQHNADAIFQKLFIFVLTNQSFWLHFFLSLIRTVYYRRKLSKISCQITGAFSLHCKKMAIMLLASSFFRHVVILKLPSVLSCKICHAKRKETGSVTSYVLIIISIIPQCSNDDMLPGYLHIRSFNLWFPSTCQTPRLFQDARVAIWLNLKRKKL